MHLQTGHLGNKQLLLADTQKKYFDTKNLVYQKVADTQKE